METPSYIPEGLPSTEEFRKTDAYWPAALCLRVGMIYLRDNPLLSKPLRIEHVKKRGLPIRVSPQPGCI
jgi:xylulose-5-phosphate/fructose-6-phosphate phosphoketolase